MTNANVYSLPIAALQHYAFCPRQFVLIHTEQVWAENHFTAEGRILHERVDSGEAEQRGTLRYERSVLLQSERHNIHGKMDLLEIETIDNTVSYFPVEYKRGKPKIDDWDRIQVCAQALCIEEMKDTQVMAGAIWYWEARKREQVLIDEDLRLVTIEMIHAARELYLSGKTTPPIKNKKRCKACSLVELCGPYTFGKDNSRSYINDLFLND